MTVYGYIRVSTDKQDTANQTYTISTYANKENLGSITFIEETVSGKKTWKSRKLAGVIDNIAEGDILIVTEMSRLGRSMLEIFEIFSICMQKGAEVHIVKNSHVLKNDIHSKVLTFAFSLAAEIERDLISKRTKEALAKRKSEGKHLGRPKGSFSSKLDVKLDEIKYIYDKGVSVSSIAKIFDVSPTAMRHFINTRMR